MSAPPAPAFALPPPVPSTTDVIVFCLSSTPVVPEPSMPPKVTPETGPPPSNRDAMSTPSTTL
jgi:hypothetical protein